MTKDEIFTHSFFATYESILSPLSHESSLYLISDDVQFFAVSPSTMGNVTVADNLKLMEVDGNFLLVGAT